MASYRFSVKHIARGQGQSATAASAYRAGEKVRGEVMLASIKTSKYQESLDNGEITERFQSQMEKRGVVLSDNAAVEKKENRWEITDGKKSYSIREQMVGKKEPKPQLSIYQNSTHNYENRSGVIHTEIITPDNAPEWTKNRSELWNTAEAADTHKNAWVAKEVQLSLPRELDLEQNKVLVQEFIQENFTNRGMVADISIHVADASDKDSVPEDDNRPFAGQNPHAHILLTTREIDGDGFASTKNRDWDKRNKVLLQEWRENWATKQNDWLENTESDERVNHQSYAKQGIDKIPETYMGKDAWNAEKNGQQTERGDRNEWVKIQNKEKEEAKQEQERQEKERVKREEKTVAEQTRLQKIKGIINDRISGFKNRFLIRRHEPEQKIEENPQKSNEDKTREKIERRERRKKAVAHAMNVVKEQSKYVAERAKRIIPRHQPQPEKSQEQQATENQQKEKAAAEQQQKDAQEKQIAEQREKEHARQQVLEKYAPNISHHQTLARERSQEHGKGIDR